MIRNWLVVLACGGALSAAALSSCSGRGAGAASARADSASLRAAGRMPFHVPDESTVRNSHLLASIRRGRALLHSTSDSLGNHVGGRLQCVSCHPDDGTLANGIPWVGVYARYPQYRSREGTTLTIEDRVNGCFRRSMNGTPLDPSSREMRDIVAYLAFLSTGYPVGATVEGQGLPGLKRLVTDSARGRAIFTSICFACHGTDGQGTGDTVPPLWGPRSFNIGAGMARLNTAAAFIRYNMPQNNRGSLTDQQAYDVAAWVLSHERPDYPGKEKDWPNGDPPSDVAYPTAAAQEKAARAAPRGGSR